jgi:hypothetical protein
MASSGMLRRVALVRTDVSEEISASFIRVTRICELVTTLAVTSNRRTLRRNTCKPQILQDRWCFPDSIRREPIECTSYLPTCLVPISQGGLQGSTLKSEDVTLVCFEITC